MQFAAMETILPSKAPDSITEAKEAGYAGIELNVDGPDAATDPIWTPANRVRMQVKAVAEEMAIPSICLGFLNRGGLTSDDPDVRADARHAIVNAIDAAAAIRAEAILVPFFGDAQIESSEERDRLVDGFQRLTDAAEAVDVTLAIENTLDGEANAELVDRIDSPKVGIYFDVGNALVYGNDPIEDIETLGPDIARVHFKDWDDDGSCRIGDGHVDYPAAVEALRDIGYDNWVVLETPSREDPIHEATVNLDRSREYVR